MTETRVTWERAVEIVEQSAEFRRRRSLWLERKRNYDAALEPHWEAYREARSAAGREVVPLNVGGSSCWDTPPSALQLDLHRRSDELNSAGIDFDNNNPRVHEPFPQNMLGNAIADGRIKAVTSDGVVMAVRQFANTLPQVLSRSYPDVHLFLTEVQDEFPPADGRSPGAETATQEPANYRTGLPGKPTSWHLIEAECRRRWGADERHPTDGQKSAAEWARVLVAWLKTEHPDAPQPTVKTVKNKLTAVLRDLRTA